jgi:hypothetical protein
MNAPFSFTEETQIVVKDIVFPWHRKVNVNQDGGWEVDSEGIPLLDSRAGTLLYSLAINREKRTLDEQTYAEVARRLAEQAADLAINRAKDGRGE